MGNSKEHRKSTTRRPLMPLRVFPHKGQATSMPMRELLERHAEKREMTREYELLLRHDLARLQVIQGKTNKPHVPEVAKLVFAAEAERQQYRAAINRQNPPSGKPVRVTPIEYLPYNLLVVKKLLDRKAISEGDYLRGTVSQLNRTRLIDKIKERIFGEGSARDEAWHFCGIIEQTMLTKATTAQLWQALLKDSPDEIYKANGMADTLGGWKSKNPKTKEFFVKYLQKNSPAWRRLPIGKKIQLTGLNKAELEK